MNRAMSQRRDAVMAGEKEQGFTLIELMVVVIIIGILAAIAIPVFLNQREAAWDASVKADLASIAIAAESYATANDGSYVNMTLGGLTGPPAAGSLRASHSLKTTAGNWFSMSTPTANSYTVIAYNSNVVTPIRQFTLSTGTIAGPTTGTTTLTAATSG